jgi:hypothetical protein
MSSELPKNCKTVAVVASETEAVEQVEQVVQEPPPFLMSLKLTYHHMSI